MNKLTLYTLCPLVSLATSFARSATFRTSYLAFSSVPPKNPVTPDFTTPVDVANIKLSRPRRPAPSNPSFVEGLEERTKGSIIPETLRQLEQDEEFQLTAKLLKEQGAKRMSLEERKKMRRALDKLGIPDFKDFLNEKGLSIPRSTPKILQLNIGLYCNQACNHCHVESSPKRTEMMNAEVADACLKLLKNSPELTTLDLTGGAPELNSEFRRLVCEARAARGDDLDIIDRCNLTVMQEPGQEDLADFLAENKVHVVASLPCYGEKNVNLQRGSGVFDKSIQALRTLNAVGYGHEDSGLKLDLVYNPLGPFLPPPQESLEGKYKEELMENFGVLFNNLFTITNMPIKRFADFLYRRGELQEYLDLLVRNFNPGALDGLMCKDTISVRWDGALFDCDFNQQTNLGMGSQKDDTLQEDMSGISIFDVDSVASFKEHEIVLVNHCYGCTAGMGSSCQGATA